MTALVTSTSLLYAMNNDRTMADLEIRTSRAFIGWNDLIYIYIFRHRLRHFLTFDDRGEPENWIFPVKYGREYLSTVKCHFQPIL